MTSRIALPDGRWFDRDTACVWEESTRWDGSNHISEATGSQWEHERLYRSRKGLWVLHSWSQWQGSSPSYELIDDAKAHQWLMRHGHAQAIPAEALAAMEA